MPQYEIEQYEIHSAKYRVDAATPADAIAQLMDGQAELVDDSTEYIEIAEDIGLGVDDCDGLASQLVQRGIPVGEHFIPSIRSVTEVKAQVEEC